MNRNIIYLSLVALSVTGCSSVNNKSAVGSFEYAEQKEQSELVIPEQLKQPEYKQDFSVKDDINHQGPIGKNVDVRAPSLVLPLAASSRVENSNGIAKIWFDKVLEDSDLKEFVYQAIVEKLADDDIALTTVDSANLVYESGWYSKTKESGIWMFESIDEQQSMRFRYQLETKPHGRSVAVSVSLIDYKKSDESGSTTTLDLIDKERFEMAMLNQIVSQVDYKYRKRNQENRIMKASQQLVTLGENAKGQAAYIVGMEADMLWSNMPILFSDYGFEVTDLNESKKIYYVDYTKPEASIWDSIWGDKVKTVDIEKGKYQFVLAAHEDKTSVTILDEAGEPLSMSILESIYPVMDVALSFRSSL